MGKYLKMADVKDLFDGIVADGHEIWCENGWTGEMLDHKSAEYTVHAINSHDELVAEVDRLRLIISECYPYIKDKADWGNEYEVDLANRIFYASK